jgi:catechol 2,3-dioxygenase-like lactoylglutathione lyase family enzyme
MTPFSPRVFRIGYIDLNAADISEAKTYYTDVIGAKIVEESSKAAYLSLGLHHHDFCLKNVSDGSAATVGYQVGAAFSLQDIGKGLAELGLTTELLRDSRPGFGDVLRTRAAGFTLEFFKDAATPAPGFGRGGVQPNRLGHVALISPDGASLVKLFTQGLGFVETDWFDDVVTFLTCNRDHHVMNVVAAPITKVHHIAFELRGQPEQFQACDLLANSGRPVMWGPTRHTAGHNLASYHYGPDRQLIELYTDMDIYLGDLGYFEPRPWHEALPQRPQRWPIAKLATWNTPAGFDLGQA